MHIPGIHADQPNEPVLGRPVCRTRVVIAREHDETAAAASPNRGRVVADGRPVPRHRLRRDHGRARRAVLGSASATTG